MDEINITQSVLIGEEVKSESIESQTNDSVLFIKLNPQVTKCNMITLLWLKFILLLALMTYVVFLPQLLVQKFGKSEKEAAKVAGQL